jgi:hypothetical protein
MATGRTAVMDTTPVDRATAAAIEAAEMRAWRDLYGAAPADFAAAAGLWTGTIGGALMLRWSASGRRYFSRTIGVGVVAPATTEAVDKILEGYERAGIAMFLLQSLPHCRPAEYEDWLRERGLEAFDAQDRIVRGAGPLAARERESDWRNLVVERVGPATADEWAEFLQRASRLDTGSWLQQLVGRRGWHQYIARQDGQVVATRSMYIGDDGMTWMGMDGPVPGITTEDYEPDSAICDLMVRDGLALGARTFLADIEAPSETQDTPAYEHFGRLGFRRPYNRTHHTRV